MSHDIYHFEVREKGRSVLPAGLRGACGFEIGTEVAAWQIGPGKAVIETRQALLEEVWVSNSNEGDVDGVEELRDMRRVESERLLAQTVPSWPEGVEELTTDEDIDAFLSSLVQ